MKNLFVGVFVAVALFTAPMAHAQVAATSTLPASQEQLDSLRQELISLLLQLIQQLQTQLDTQLASDERQDREITSIKKTVNIVDDAPVDGDTEEEDVDDVRSTLGEVKATANVEEDDGEYTVAFSITNYLDVDSVRFSANVDSLETEGGCNAIQDSSYEVCGLSVVYPIASTTSPVVIDVTVNGVEKQLVVEYGKKALQQVTWPNP